MKFSTWKQTPQEKKRFTIAYTDWLADGEVIDNVTYAIDNVTTPPLLVESSTVNGDGLGITFYISGGLDEEQYQLRILAETDAGQRKEDYFTIVVEEP